MSALPPKADIHRHDGDVRFVPNADMVNGIFTKKNRRRGFSIPSDACGLCCHQRRASTSGDKGLQKPDAGLHAFIGA
jgi:hypothetical protein